MELIKRIASAIFLALLLALPLGLLEAFIVHHIIKMYNIPYFLNFQYCHILGISFIVMITRNRIRLPEKDENLKGFFEEIYPATINRMFRISFVWIVATVIYVYLGL